MPKRNFTPESKVKLVLEALREERTIGEIAAAHQINPNMLTRWRREFLERAASVFYEPHQAKALRKAEKNAEAERTQMLKTIGQLTMERDYLKAATEAINATDGRRLL